MFKTIHLYPIFNIKAFGKNNVIECSVGFNNSLTIDSVDGSRAELKYGLKYLILQISLNITKKAKIRPRCYVSLLSNFCRLRFGKKSTDIHTFTKR